MDTSLGLSVLLLFITFGVIGGFIVKLWWDEQKAAKRRREILSMGTENTAQQENLTRNDVKRPQRRRFADRQDADDYRENQDQNDEGGSDDFVGGENDENNAVEGEDTKKLGKKKLAKLQAKAEAKAQREAEQAERAERRKREEEKAKEAEAQRKAEEEEERKQQEKLKAEQEEKKRRELEEYNKLKVAFSVEEQGFDHKETDESDNLVQIFLDHLKSSKVVYVDELAARFSLKIDECVERINRFIEDKMLNGVMDERGKFICITDDELNAVAKFINQRGRISVQELVEYSNKLISLEPTNNITRECN